MKAAIRTRYGPPNVLRIADVEKHIPKKDEVLIKVHATTVNRTDCGLLRGIPFPIRFFTGLRKPRLITLGTDFAGRVEQVGSHVRPSE